MKDYFLGSCFKALFSHCLFPPTAETTDLLQVLSLSTLPQGVTRSQGRCPSSHAFHLSQEAQVIAPARDILPGMSQPLYSFTSCVSVSHCPIIFLYIYFYPAGSMGLCSNSFWAIWFWAHFAAESDCFGYIMKWGWNSLNIVDSHTRKNRKPNNSFTKHTNIKVGKTRAN